MNENDDVEYLINNLIPEQMNEVEKMLEISIPDDMQIQKIVAYGTFVSNM